MTTNTCNLACAHCYQDAQEATDAELSTAEAQKMIGEIARAGFKTMIFSGGEPLMRKDIFELIECASSFGLRPVLGSNGTLITPSIAYKLKHAGACSIGISIDSLNTKRHDAFRGVDNALRMTLDGIAACKEVGLPFQIHTTVMDWNTTEICDITDFAEHIGAKAHFIFFLIPVGRAKNIEDTMLAAKENEELLKAILVKSQNVSIPVKPTCAPQFMRIADQLDINTPYHKGCLAGLTYCVIGSEGKVRPCAYMTEEAGDVRVQKFDDIWHESSLFKALRTQAYSGACGICEFKEVCGGCRARAAGYHQGDVLAQDDCCAYGIQSVLRKDS